VLRTLGLKAVIRQLRDYVATARDIARHDGVVILLWRVIAKLLSPVLDLDCQILFEIDLSKPVEQRHARVECRIEPGTEADVDELLEMRIPSWRLGDADQLSDADEYRLLLVERERARARAGARVYMRQWFRAGEKCFVARVDGEIAHSNWTRFHGCTPAPRREIDPQEGEIYTTEGYTVPRWRGKGLHEAVLSHMLRFAQERGCRRAYTITDFTNARARRGVLRVSGWRWRGRHLYITPRRWGRTWLLRLGGNVGPIVRDLQGEPIRLL